MYKQVHTGQLDLEGLFTSIFAEVGSLALWKLMGAGSTVSLLYKMSPFFSKSVGFALLGSYTEDCTPGIHRGGGAERKHLENT